MCINHTNNTLCYSIFFNYILHKTRRKKKTKWKYPLQRPPQIKFWKRFEIVCNHKTCLRKQAEFFQSTYKASSTVYIKHWPFDGINDVVVSTRFATVSCRLFRSASGSWTRESLIVHWQWIWTLAQAIVSIAMTFLREKCEGKTWLVRVSMPPLGADDALFAVFVNVIWQRIGSPAKYTEPLKSLTSISTISVGDKTLH